MCAMRSVTITKNNMPKKATTKKKQGGGAGAVATVKSPKKVKATGGDGAKEKPKKELLNIDEAEEASKIESELYLESIVLKDMKWNIKLTVKKTLPKSYHKYKVVLELDETPYAERIEEIESELNDSLFRDDKASRKTMQNRVGDIRKQLEAVRNDCEKIDFHATIEELKYKDSDTKLVMRVPDDVIEPFNRQKTRFDVYKITLYPVYD